MTKPAPPDRAAPDDPDDPDRSPPEGRGRAVLRTLRDIGGTLLFAVVLLIVVGRLRAPDLPEAAPALRLPSLAGPTVDLSALRGERVLVNFWATWCGPCRLELPALLAADGGEVPILFVSVDHDLGALEAFAKAKGMPLDRVLVSDGETQARWGADTLPTSVLIEADGSVGAAHAGLLSPPQLWWWTR
jgi:thiol-disulfide isomerase/thioredoxin